VCVKAVFRHFKPVLHQSVGEERRLLEEKASRQVFGKGNGIKCKLLVLYIADNT
jgi:hypothetical protein